MSSIVHWSQKQFCKDYLENTCHLANGMRDKIQILISQSNSAVKGQTLIQKVKILKSALNLQEKLEPQTVELSLLFSRRIANVTLKFFLHFCYCYCYYNKMFAAHHQCVWCFLEVPIQRRELWVKIWQRNQERMLSIKTYIYLESNKAQSNEFTIRMFLKL